MAPATIYLILPGAGGLAGTVEIVHLQEGLTSFRDLACRIEDELARHLPPVNDSCLYLTLTSNPPANSAALALPPVEVRQAGTLRGEVVRLLNRWDFSGARLLIRTLLPGAAAILAAVQAAEARMALDMERAAHHARRACTETENAELCDLFADLLEQGVKRGIGQPTGFARVQALAELASAIEGQLRQREFPDVLWRIRAFEEEAREWVIEQRVAATWSQSLLIEAVRADADCLARLRELRNEMVHELRGVSSGALDQKLPVTLRPACTKLPSFLRLTVEKMAQTMDAEVAFFDYDRLNAWIIGQLNDVA